MKGFLCILALLVSLTTFAQIQIDWIEVYENEEDGKINLYALNSGHCPVSVMMSFPTIKNLKASKSLPVEMVILNDGEEHLIVSLSVINEKAGSNYAFDFRYALGNIYDTQHDNNYAYTLPFQKGKRSVVGQGYNGRFSHDGLLALDFDLKVDTEVLAARAGTVVAIKEDSDKGCKSQKCKGQANYILIYHDEDGTFASYVHLKKDGAAVQPGDKVKPGQLIGYSGNTGWSSGPHLHFEVYVPELNTRKSVKTKFKLDDGSVELLEERKSYTSK
jgi:murein DD-endopeptidase MepM/ murein hydrolase activator NlpD